MMRPGDDPSYDVHVWGIHVYKGKRGTTYTVRWQVAGSPHQRTFTTRKLAESFRAGLLTAARGGSSRDGFTDLERQARDQRKRLFRRKLPPAFPPNIRRQPWPTGHGRVDLPIDGVLVLKVEREALLGERVQSFIQSWDRLSPIDPQREVAKRLRPDRPAAGDSLEPVVVEEPASHR
jgi:hypothetical protein